MVAASACLLLAGAGGFLVITTGQTAAQMDAGCRAWRQARMKQGADLAALGFSKLFHSTVASHRDDLQVRQPCGLPCGIFHG